MRRITKQSLDELAATMPIVSFEEQSNSIGGSDCLLHVYSTISGFSVEDLVGRVVTGLGYNVYEKGGIEPDHILNVAYFAQLYVTQIQADFSFNNTTGKLPNGSTLMITYNTGIRDHAVIATNYDNSTETFTFMDPQNSIVGPIHESQVIGYFSVHN